MVMQIIAQRGEQQLLVVDRDGIPNDAWQKRGRIFDVRAETFGPPMLVEQILKWGYWEEFDAPEDFNGEKRFYDPNQQRDYHGRFGTGGPPPGKGKAAAKTKAPTPAKPKPLAVAGQKSAARKAPIKPPPKGAQANPVLALKTSNGNARIVGMKAGIVEIEYLDGKYKGQRQTMPVSSTRKDAGELRAALTSLADPAKPAERVAQPKKAPAVAPDTRGVDDASTGRVAPTTTTPKTAKPAPSGSEGDPSEANRARHQATEERLRAGKLSDDWEPLGTVGSKPSLGEHINEVYKAKLTTDDGEMEVVIKPEKGLTTNVWRTGMQGTDLEREEAASYVGKELGLVQVPPYIARDSQQGRAGVQEFIPSNGTIAKLEAAPPWEGLDYLDSNRAALIQEMRRIAIYDAVVGNLDRHEGNVLVRENPQQGESRLVPIDHGYSFPDSTSTNVGRYIFLDRMDEPDNTLTNVELRHLDDFTAKRKQIDANLKKIGINDDAVSEMWKRVEFMRKKRAAMDNYNFHGKHWED